jgi:CheY-like chemotaxis protein/GAF domain-containing protein
MADDRPRLIIPPGSTLEPAARARLAAEFELVDASTAEGRAALRSIVASPIPEANAGGLVTGLLEALGEGLGIVEETGEITWLNEELGAQSPEVLRRFADSCAELLRSAEKGLIELGPRTSERLCFRVGTRCYEVVATGLGSPVRRVAAILLDVTERRRLQERIDALDAAGSALLVIDAECVEKGNPADRLRALDGRVIAAVRNGFGWEHFEFRILNRETEQLELVFCSGLAPLGIGEKIFARPEGNGISGLVASTGEAMVVRDVRKEPRYLRALPTALSSLTVPLRLHDRVVGVFNVESERLDAFTEEDRFCAEIFGRYVALALNILDMLVVERRTTNRRVATTVLGEIGKPLDQIATIAQRIEEGADARVVEEAERILDAVSTIRNRVEAATSGPQTILGVEEVLREGTSDPSLAGKRVLVADDEAAIRETIAEALTRKGCVVTTFASGVPAIDRIRAEAEAGRPFDLVVSDVRMPDRNGYEVFKAVKEASERTPVILMTGFGYDPHHSIVRCSQEGLHCFLFKPFQLSQLIEEVRKALPAQSTA